MARGHGMSWAVDWPLTRDQLRYGFQTHIGNIAQRLNLQVSTIILSSMLGATAVGLFSVTVTLAQVLWYIPDSVGRILFPRVASSSREEANRVTPLVCRNTILLVAIASLVLFLVGRWIIVTIYGDEFIGAVQPLYLLLPGIVALSISKVLTKYLSGVGKPFFNSTASVVSFLVNAPLLYVLVRSHGLPGAAIASSIAYLVHAIVVVAFYARESRTPVGPTLLPTPGDFHLYADGASQIAAALSGRRRGKGGTR
jgi:O-antigen/teichoic acid export membrane protein